MDSIHENSIHAISVIQKSFNDQKNVMFALSNIFDPRYAFLFYAPLIFSLDQRTGRKLMWVTVIAEWSNQVLKWLMRGERPYWWVHEFGNSAAGGASNTELPTIEQTFMTCETGPGSPSGHSMVTAAVWYILVEAMLQRIKRNGGNDEDGSGFVRSKRSLVEPICWSIYTFVLCCVSLSRIYLAAHFPHQCLLGMIMGVAVAMTISALDTDNVSRRAYILGTIGMAATAFATYITLLAFGFNPLWSVERALKWCAKREHVHLDTTPFFSMMRYLGFFLGMGIGLHSPLRKQADKIFNTKNGAGALLQRNNLIAAALSVGTSKVMEKIPLPTGTVNVNIIYALVFGQSMLLPYLFVAVIPYLVAKFCGKQDTKATATTTATTSSSSQQNGCRTTMMMNGGGGGHKEDSNNNTIKLKAQ